MAHKTTSFLLCGLLIFCLFVSPRAAFAQQSPPISLPALEAGEAPIYYEDAPALGLRQKNGLWQSLDGGPVADSAVQAQALVRDGGFGYARSAAHYQWIDASGGQLLDLSSSDSLSVTLPFAFKFYETTFSQVGVYRYGYLSFTPGPANLQSRLPYAAAPNNLVAPYLAPLVNYGGGVYLLTGGEAPNRFVVVEWLNLDDPDGANRYTFEVVLYESGDLLFQYNRMDYNRPYYCAAAGIEDADGAQGMQTLKYCARQPAGRAVRLIHPAPTARVGFEGFTQGQFAAPGQMVEYHLRLRNSGDLGADNYSLQVRSGWPASVRRGDGTLLTDSNGDHRLETGLVASGSALDVVISVQVPAKAAAGSTSAATFTAISTRNPKQRQSVRLDTTVPAAFAQAYTQVVGGGASEMRLFLASPGGQAEQVISSGQASYQVMTVLPGGKFLYAWSAQVCLDTACAKYNREIEYVVLGPDGAAQGAPRKLADLSGEPTVTWDYFPALADAPDGSTGLTWVRRVFNDGLTASSSNVYFAALDASGGVAAGPVQVTANAGWYQHGNFSFVPRYFRPQLASSGDGRFVLAWQRSQDGYYGPLDDIYFAIMDSQGGVITAPTQLTADPGDGMWYQTPTAAPLEPGRVLLAWNSLRGAAYLVVGSDGSTLRSGTFASAGGWGIDAARLSSGQVVLAWSVLSQDRARVYYAALSPAYRKLGGVQALDSPAALTGSADVSIAALPGGKAVITYQDFEWGRNLYYSLYNPTSRRASAPVIFLSGQDGTIQANQWGQGNGPSQ